METQKQSAGLRDVMLHDLDPVLQRYGITPSFEVKGTKKPYHYLKDSGTSLEIWISEEVADFALGNYSENCELQDFDGPAHLSKYFLEKLTNALDATSQGAS